MTMRMNRQALSGCSLLAVTISAHLAKAQNAVTFTIDASQNVQAISPYIYGINQPITSGSNLTYDRLGGNRWTAYNWTNNYSNAGSDYKYSNDTFLGGGSTPGGAMIPGITNAAANNAGLLLTVPMAGYVSTAKSGYASPTANPATSPYFVPEYASAPASVTSMSTNPMYESQFVNSASTASIPPTSGPAHPANPISRPLLPCTVTITAREQCLVIRPYPPAPAMRRTHRFTPVWIPKIRRTWS